MTKQTSLERDKEILKTVTYASFDKMQRQQLTKLTMKPQILALLCGTTPSTLKKGLQRYYPKTYKEIAFIVDFGWGREEVRFTRNALTAEFIKEARLEEYFGKNTSFVTLVTKALAHMEVSLGYGFSMKQSVVTYDFDSCFPNFLKN